MLFFILLKTNICIEYYQDISKQLIYEKIDEILEEDPKRNLNANEMQSKLESIMCTDLSVHKQSIRNFLCLNVQEIQI